MAGLLQPHLGYPFWQSLLGFLSSRWPWRVRGLCPCWRLGPARPSSVAARPHSSPLSYAAPASVHMNTFLPPLQPYKESLAWRWESWLATEFQNSEMRHWTIWEPQDLRGKGGFLDRVSNLLRISNLDLGGCPHYWAPNRIKKRQVSEKLNMASQLVQLLSNKLVFLKNISNSLVSGTSWFFFGCVQISLTW